VMNAFLKEGEVMEHDKRIFFPDQAI